MDRFKLAQSDQIKKYWSYLGACIIWNFSIHSSLYILFGFTALWMARCKLLYSSPTIKESVGLCCNNNSSSSATSCQLCPLFLNLLCCHHKRSQQSWNWSCWRGSQFKRWHFCWFFSVWWKWDQIKWYEEWKAKVENECWTAVSSAIPQNKFVFYNYFHVATTHFTLKFYKIKSSIFLHSILLG